MCLNLLLNALKYTPNGYIVVTLQKKWLRKMAGRERSALVELVVSFRGDQWTEDAGYADTNALGRGFGHWHVR